MERFPRNKNASVDAGISAEYKKAWIAKGFMLFCEVARSVICGLIILTIYMEK